MKISYNEATARGCSNLELDLKLCEQAGFDYIEIRLDMLKEYLKGHYVEELAEFFNTSHMKPHALNALYLYPEFLGDEDDEERQKELLADFNLGCEVGKTIGSRYFIIVPPLQSNPDGGPFIGSREETFQNCVRILRKLGAMADSYDINLCFELVGFARSSVRTVDEADAIVRAVDLANVGFVFDSYNLYLNGCTNEFSLLKKVQPEKIFAVHMISGKDVPEEEMGQDKRCFADRGVVDIGNFLANLKETGYNGMVSVEAFNPEYWEQTPQWVIDTAFWTTRDMLEKNGCISY